MAPSYIADDLWPEILRRVADLKALCRFRCVCKSWNSLLLSYDSIDQLTSTPTAHKPYLLLNGWDRSIFGDADPAAIYRPQATPNRAKTYLDFPFKAYDGSRSFTIIGVIHGVVCLAHYLGFHSPHSYGSVVLWMPLSNKYIRVPPSDLQITFEGHRVLGFGYDVSKNDFKVVSFYSEYLQFEVFSVQDRLWRVLYLGNELQSQIIGPQLGSISFFMNGSIHWIGRRFWRSRTATNTVDCLLALDCEREKLTTMEAPPDFRTGLGPSLRVLKYHGKLALLKHTVSGSYECSELWAMEDYGVARTWTKKLHMNHRRIEYILRMQPVMFMDDEVLPRPVDHPNDHGNVECSCVAESEPPLHGLALEESIVTTDLRLGASSLEKEENVYIRAAHRAMVIEDVPPLGCAAVLINKFMKLISRK